MDDDRMSVSSGSSDVYDPADTVLAPAPGAVPSTVSHPGGTSGAPGHKIDDVVGRDSALSGTGTHPEYNVEATTGPRSIADDLPAEVWQQVLSYLNPPELGRAMRVSKSVLRCLDGSIPAKQRLATPPGTLQTLDSESIWASWRISHLEEAGNMPKPVEGHTERDMWKLIRGVRCDVCGKPDTEPRKPISPDRWHGGPTMSTTRAVWSFALRMCGECLYRYCEKDTSLLCNPTTQRFRPALPYAMVTHDFHYIPTTILKEAGQAPSGLHVAKQYFKPHIADIVADWERTLALGHGAAEEWLKGLSGMGKQTALDSARWERWEAKGGYNRVLFAFTQLQPAPLLQPTPTPGWAQPNVLGWPIQSLPPQQQQFGIPPNTPAATLLQQISVTPNNFTPAQTQAQFSPQASLPGPFAQPLPPMPSPNIAMPSAQQRQDRNPRKAEDAKAARRQQIEQLCLNELDPPIPPNVLRHMPSFQAAIMIGVPLNDHGWEMLKPKLLEQHEQALAMERETTRQLLAVQQQVQAESKRQASQNAKDGRDAQEKDWEDKLRPQRDRLGAIADSYIRQQWRGGQSVNSGNVARFAMSVFDHVRRTFYNELQNSDQMTLMMGHPLPQDPPDGPFLRRLTLETMKWVYDHKIRPLARDYGKEIFFCNGLGCEFTNKHFAFEGVIQHYGAKHTNDYSKGNVIVHWQTAEWPEDLPFYDPGSGPTRPHYGGYSRGTTISPQVHSGAPYSLPSLTTSPFVPTPRSNLGNGPFTPPVGIGLMQYTKPAQSSAVQYSGNHLVNPPSALIGSDPTDLSQFFQSTGTGKTDTAVPKAVLDRDAMEDKLSRIMEELTAKSVQPIAPGVGAVPSEERKPSLMDVDIPDFAMFQDQQNHVAETARLAWTRTNAIDGMLTSVRVFAVLQYALLQFSHRFRTKLSIGTFATALMNKSGLEPLKHANELLCNQCRTNAGAFPRALTVAVDLWTLMEHFQEVHVPRNTTGVGDAAGVNWVKEMIALPPPETIPELINAAGMRDEKLTILADAFPGQLPRKMPHGKSAADSLDGKQTRKNKRSGRKASNGRRQDFEDANIGDDESSGYNGVHSTHSPPNAGGPRRKSPKHYEDEEDEYDPAKPMLPDKTRKRRDFGRKTSGMGPGPSLEEMIRIETEKSNRAAAEENRRRGIVADMSFDAAHSGEMAVDPAVQHHLRLAASSSRPSSAPRAVEVYSSHYDKGVDRPNSGHHSQVDRTQHHHTEHYHPERAVSRPSRVVGDGHVGDYATATPPSGRKGRYARYDEQHERLLQDRTRSRSPIRYEDTFHERPPLRQREHLASDQPHVPYRYADEPGGVIYDQYGRRLIPVADDAPTRPGYTLQQHNPGQFDHLEHRQELYEPQYYTAHQEPSYAPHPTYDNRPAPFPQQPQPARNSRYAE